MNKDLERLLELESIITAKGLHSGKEVEEYCNLKSKLNEKLEKYDESQKINNGWVVDEKLKYRYGGEDTQEQQIKQLQERLKKYESE
jgi:predicted nuclease with TOPRIM domain